MGTAAVASAASQQASGRVELWARAGRRQGGVAGLAAPSKQPCRVCSWQAAMLGPSCRDADFPLSGQLREPCPGAARCRHAMPPQPSRPGSPLPPRAACWQHVHPPTGICCPLTLAPRSARSPAPPHEPLPWPASATLILALARCHPRAQPAASNDSTRTQHPAPSRQPPPVGGADDLVARHGGVGNLAHHIAVGEAHHQAAEGKGAGG